MRNKEIILWILKYFLIWRLSLFFFAFLGLKLLPFKESFPYSEIYLKDQGSPLFWSWANFDGVHYLGIAQKGYFAQFTQAFLPLYSLLIRYLTKIFGNYIFSGLLISNLSFFLALFLLFGLVKGDFNEKVAKRTVIFLLFFPTSFFFASLYTESLFLTLVLAAFLLARKKRWFLAGLVGFFASLTRLVGIFLVPSIFCEMQEKKSKPKKGILSFLYCLLPFLGLLIYMLYLKKSFGEPFYFLTAQPAFGAQRTGGKIILLYQVFWRYLKMFFTIKNNNLLYFSVLLEFLSTLVFLGLLIYVYLRLRFAYFLFAILAFVAPTLTGTLSSMPRYVLVLFPCFIVLAMIKKKVVRLVILVVSFILLMICTMLFTRGYWIA